jgi:hypothetical protein
VDFTREPIIETIMSPREGCKLLVRSSKNTENAEEYYVDAIEVVSFGQAFFFRSLERPKAFLVPVSDYEIVEVKEPRVALKTGHHDRNIKIGGGREASLRHTPQRPQEREEEGASVEEEGSSSSTEEGMEPGAHPRSDKRRDRRRRRHRRPQDEQEWAARRQEEAPIDGAPKAQEGEAQAFPPSFPSLIPPPSTLISDTISRYKDKEFMGKPFLPKEVEEKAPNKEESPGADTSSLSRTLLENRGTSFSPIFSDKDSYFF